MRFDGGLPPLLFLLTFAAAWAATGLILPLLRGRRILDHPNPRSSHDEPTPRGGGIAVVGVLALAWIGIELLLGAGDPRVLWVLLPGLLLAAVSWVDDLRGLSPAPRFLAQVMAVAAGSAALMGQGPVFQGLLPPLLDVLLASLCWLWFVNLFNFMDGIDGISGAESASVGIGLFLVLAIADGDLGIALAALTAAAAALAFLWWNWQPARLFLGDVGSVPLGFLLGWLLLSAAAAGHWQAALILPLYYLLDATITLARRLARGAPPWRAHREHFYQQAVRRGLSHAAVVRRVLAANGVLVLLACAAALADAGPREAAALWPLGAALLVVGVLLARLAGRRAG